MLRTIIVIAVAFVAGTVFGATVPEMVWPHLETAVEFVSAKAPVEADYTPPVLVAPEQP